VSFTLSVMLALRARRLDASGIGALWPALVRRAVSRPLDLVRPPAEAPRDGAPLRGPRSDA
jgi:site-specific recombinase